MNQPNNYTPKAYAAAKMALLLLLLGFVLSMTPLTEAKVAETTVNADQTAAQANDVLLVINPATRSVIQGQTFVMTVQVQAGNQEVEGVAAYLNFDPAVLQVQSITPTAIPSWESVSSNTFNNSNGQIDYRVGISRPQFWPYPTGTFDLLQVEFQAIANSPGTTISFNSGAPRNRNVTAPGGASVLTGTANGYVVVSPITLTALGGLDSVDLNWNLVGPLPGQLARYELYRSTDGGNYSFITSTRGSQYTDDDPTLTTGVEYCYQVRAVDGANNVLVQSNMACVEFGTLALWIPDEVAPPSATGVGVPINIANADGLCIGAMDITISYDTTIATATGTVASTIHTQGYFFITNTNTPGQIKITSITAQCNELYGAGGLFVVDFDIIGNEGDVSPLNFITGVTNTVIYDESDFSTAVGLGLQNGSLTVGFNFVRGDISGDGVVNSADAALALRIANGLRTPTTQEVRACDVNGDGGCNSGDAVLILCFASSQDWDACLNPQTRSLALLALPDEAVQLSFGAIQNLPEQKIRVPVMMGNAPDLTGATLSFLYDATQMTPTEVFMTSLTGNFLLEANTEPAGLLRVALASNQPIGGDGPIMMLEFDVINGVSSLEIGDARLYDNVGRDFVTSSLQREIEIIPQTPPSEMVLEGSVSLQGRPAAPDARWSVDLTVSLSEAGHEGDPTYQFTPTTDENGHFTLTGIEPGTYDIRVKKSTALQNTQTVTLVDGTNSIDFGTLREGDVNDDNFVTILDFSILAATFGICEGADGYDARADLNGDTCITILDFSLLSSNFGQGGDALRAPLTAPSTQEVAMSVAPAQTNVVAGEQFNVTVQLETGDQSVDGAQVVLNFDSSLLEVVAMTASDTDKLPLELQKQFDNANGTIAFAAGALEDFPAGTIPVVEVEFRALAETEATSLAFGSPDSLVTFSGAALSAELTDSTITISAAPTSVTLNSLSTMSPAALSLLALAPLSLTILAGAWVMRRRRR